MVRLRRRFAPLHGPICPDQQRDGARYRNDARLTKTVPLPRDVHNSASLGQGTGLLGEYYANTFPSNPFIGSPLVRTDAVVNFNWNSVSPDRAFHR